MKKINYIGLAFIFIFTFFLSGCTQYNSQDITDTSKNNKKTECGPCPQLSPPGPQFCQDGTMVPGDKNDCGCQMPPKCIK